MLRTKIGMTNLVELAYIGIAIIEKWIAFRDCDMLNSNPAMLSK